MKKQINTKRAIKMYTRDLLTLREIGARMGVSAPGVLKALRRSGVNPRDGGRPLVNCAQCGSAFRKWRNKVKTSAKHYCSNTCYMLSLRNEDYREWRHGCRIARKIISEQFQVLPGMVIHHHDSNQRNNDLRNLAVFASHSEHMSYERGGKAKPIWDGRKMT